MLGAEARCAELGTHLSVVPETLHTAPRDAMRAQFDPGQWSAIEAQAAAMPREELVARAVEVLEGCAVGERARRGSPGS